MAGTILVVGEVMLDVIAPAATSGRTHTAIEVRAGGTAVNAALAARAAGAAVVVAGRIGDDVAGAAVREALAHADVRSALVVDDAKPTGTYVEVGDTRIVSRGANARLVPSDIPDGDYDAVLVSGYVAVHDDTVAVAQHALASSARWRAVIATPLRTDDFAARAAGANVLFANADEAERLPATYEIVCVTDGARGAAVIRGGVATPLAPSGVAGTGAGDAFAGAYLAGL